MLYTVIRLATLMLLGGILSLASPFPQYALCNGIDWNSYEEGLKRGEVQQKKLFINFYATWCRYCKTMDNETFTDPSIVGYISDHYIAVKVDVEKERDVAAQFRINPLPDSWFVAENGEPIGNRPGFLSAEELLPILKFIHTDSYIEMSYADFLETQ